MKDKKTVKLILLLLILIIAFLTIRSTYSKYITQADNYSKLNISNWNIKLNNIDIMENTSFTDNISITYDSNEHIAEGVIVPTSKGYFDLSLESTGTELPFEYAISINQEKPYNFTINNTSTNDDSTLYYYDTTLNITNTNADLSNWELSFLIPDSLNEANSTFTDISNYLIDGNKITITSDTTFSSGETKTLNIIFATENSVDFIISNVTLNNTNLDKLTDRISDFRITSYTLNGSTYAVPLSESAIKGTITPPADLTTEVIQNFTFTIEWYDGEDNILDNFEDVAAIKNSLPATIPITLKVTQLPNTTTP